MKVSAPKTRMAIAKLWTDGMTAAEIATIIRTRYPKIIDEERLEIEDVGLKKIVGAVLRRASKPTDDAQLNFHREFRLPERVSLRVTSEKGVQSINRSIYSMTLAEAESYIAQREKPRALPKGLKEFKRAIAFAKSKGALPDEKLFDIWSEGRASGGGGV